MAKFFGKVGYGEAVETPPGSGVWKDKITEHEYYGDVIRDSRRLEPGEHLNDNVIVGNSISIIADQYAIDHFAKIKYVNWAGTLWIVTTVEVRSPRLVLYLGGVYNGPTA